MTLLRLATMAQKAASSLGAGNDNVLQVSTQVKVSEGVFCSRGAGRGPWWTSQVDVLVWRLKTDGRKAGSTGSVVGTPPCGLSRSTGTFIASRDSESRVVPQGSRTSRLLAFYDLASKPPSVASDAVHWRKQSQGLSFKGTRHSDESRVKGFATML